MVICPEGKQGPEQHGGVSAEGRTVCGLIRRLNSSCERPMAFLVHALFHWLGGRRAKAEWLSGLLQAVERDT
jgi:hypothetical protein